MRLVHLDLKAYGPFTEERIVFGEDGIDMVYGLNEAGKSTALRALRGLLYGIPARTADNFLHEYRDLRVGGKLLLSDGSSLEFLRRKGNRDTLLKPDGAGVIADRELARFLGAVSEEQFSRRFGLDHQALVEGGRIILEGGGELGESLLAAGTGGASVRRLLQELEEEADGLFKPRASSTRINAKLREYEEARKLASALSLSAGEWETLNRQLENAVSELGELAAAMEERGREKTRLERLQQALPLLARRNDLLAELEELGEVVILPEGFSESRRKAEDKLLRARENHRRASEAVERLKGEIDKLEVPETLLSQGENVNAIYGLLGSHNKAMNDLPQRERDRDERLAEARTLLRGIRPDLGLKEVLPLRAGLSSRASIQKLAGDHGQIMTRIEISKRGIAEEGNNLEKIEDELVRLEAPRDASALRAALRNLQAEGNLAGMSEELERDIAREGSQARAELASLPLWQGTLEELEALAVPAQETVDRFEGRMQELLSALDEKERDAERLKEELGRERRRRERLAAGGAVPSEEALDSARSRRDLGWSLVKRAWLEGEDVSREEKKYDPERRLPEAYEARVAEADETADRMRKEADRAAELSQSDQRIKEIEADLAALREEAEEIRGKLEEAGREWEDAWKETGLKPLTPREMRAWLNRQQGLVRAVRSIRELEQRREEVRASIARHAEELAELMESLGEKAAAGQGLEILAARAQELCDHIGGVEAERARLEGERKQLERRLASRREDLGSAQSELEEWRKAWTESVTGTGLPPETEPEAALAYMQALDDLFRVLDEADGYEKRIADIRNDAKSFGEKVRGFVSAFAPDLEGAPVEQAAAELHARLLKAKEAKAQETAKRSELESQEADAARAASEIREAEAALRGLCKQAGCASPEQLAEAERRSEERQRLKRELEQLEEQLLPFRKGEPLESLLAEAEEVDADSLPGKLEDMGRELEEMEGRRSRLEQEIGALRNQLGGMDGNEKAAEEAEKAQAALASLRPLAERYAVLRAAWLLLHEEAERYRQRNQDPVLARAGEVFSALTVGYFHGLDLEYDDGDRPVIVGVRPSGETVGVRGMSDGTCDQLYLALRIAFIEAFLENNEPFPVILDDILIRFDDQRAKAAIEVLMQLARMTQVIFFTHHSRLVDIAREVAGGEGLRVHELVPRRP